MFTKRCANVWLRSGQQRRSAPLIYENRRLIWFGRKEHQQIIVNDAGKPLEIQYPSHFTRFDPKEWRHYVKSSFKTTFLPSEYPNSVTKEYAEYSIWQAVHNGTGSVTGGISWVFHIFMNIEPII